MPVLLVLVLLVAALSAATAATATTVSIVFIGNLIVQPTCPGVPSLDDYVAQLARGNGHAIDVRAVVVGNEFTLARHANEHLAEITAALAQAPDVVVLQEQTQAPLYPAFLERSLAALRTTFAPLLAPHKNQTVLLYGNYARLYGDDPARLATFAAMQDALDTRLETYIRVLRGAGVASVAVLPVGSAFRKVNDAHARHLDRFYCMARQDRALVNQPTTMAQYVAATLLYRAIFGESPPSVPAMVPPVLSWQRSINTLVYTALGTAPP